MTARERLGGSTRLSRDIDDDVEPIVERRAAGKRSLLDDDVVATAPGRALLEYQGLIGFLRNLKDRLVLALKGKSEPKRGSRAFEAQAELNKLPELIYGVYEDLRAGKITEEAAASKMKDMQAQMMRAEQAINELGEGKGFIASHDDVTKAAIGKGYPPAPEGHYYFETADGNYQLQRAVDSTAPPQHVENQGGKWVLVAGEPKVAVGADITALKKNLADRLGVAPDKVTLHSDGTAADPAVKANADGSYEIHYKQGTPEDVLMKAVDHAKEAGASDRWLLDLKNQLTPDQRIELERMTKGKTAAEIFQMFGGDMDVALAKVGGSNLPNDLIQVRNKLGDKAKRAFDHEWSKTVGDERNPAPEKVKKFRDALDALAKHAGDDLAKGLEGEEAKIPAGTKISEPKGALPEHAAKIIGDKAGAEAAAKAAHGAVAAEASKIHRAKPAQIEAEVKRVVAEPAKDAANAAAKNALENGATDADAKIAADNAAKAVADARAKELLDLAKDPAQGGKILPKSIREAEVGKSLEDSGKLDGPLTRDPRRRGRAGARTIAG